MSKNQYGFREGYSTVMALTDLVDNTANAIDKKNTHNISIFRACKSLLHNRSFLITKN